MKQGSLFAVPREFHGGELSRGKRKSLRPLARKRPIHLVIKADRLLIQARPWIRAEVKRFAARFSIKLYGLAVNPDHVHFVIGIPSRRGYAAFLRALTARIAKRVGKGLWKVLPFTRVAHWGKDFKNLLRYLQMNHEETHVECAYTPRKDYYRRYRSNREREP